MVQRVELSIRWRRRTTERNERTEPHLRHHDLSFRAAAHDSGGVIMVAVDDIPAFRGERQKPQHMAARDGGDECLLGVDSRGNRERRGHRMRRRGGGDFNPAIEDPAMTTAVTIVGEDGALPVPRDCRGVFAQGAGPRAYPPLTAASTRIVLPAGAGVLSPSRKRILSPLTKTLTCRLTL